MIHEDEMERLLEEIYVFIAMKHKACDPWRIALDEWQSKVEDLTGWDAYQTIEKFRKNEKS